VAAATRKPADGTGGFASHRRQKNSPNAGYALRAVFSGSRRSSMASAATRSYFPRIIHRRRRNAPKSHSGRFPIGAGASAGKGGNRSRVPRRPQGDGRGVAVARGSTPRLSELPQMPRSSKLKGLISFRRSKRLKLERGRCAQSAASLPRR
jgi:hypothetical protein